MSMTLELRAVNDDMLNGLMDGDPETCEAFLSGDGTDLDKAWDGIHFALTGKKFGDGSGRMSYEPFGDRYLDAVDEGMGPATYLAPEEVAVVARHLKGIPAEAFAALVDAKAMIAAEIYPFQQDETDADVRPYLVPNYAAMRELYLSASSSGMGIVAVMR